MYKICNKYDTSVSILLCLLTSYTRMENRRSGRFEAPRICKSCRLRLRSRKSGGFEGAELFPHSAIGPGAEDPGVRPLCASSTDQAKFHATRSDL